MRAHKLTERDIRRLVDALNADAIELPDVQIGARGRAITTYLDYYQRRAERLARQLSRGDMTLSAWRDSMAKELYNLHTTMYAIGNGSTQLSYDDRQLIQAQVNEQLAYLDNWYAQMAEAEQLPTEQALISRANLYGGAANMTEQIAETTKAGLPVLPFYPADRTDCHTNCHCRWKWIKLSGENNYDVYWVMGAVEHCDSCINRARACSPLKVRGGEIQDPSKFMRANLYA